MPMANQIAVFFRSYPEEDAIAGVADHIRAFWTPGMRAALSARIEQSQAGIEPLVVRAMTQPRPPCGESPIAKEIKGPGQLGEAVSDAG